MSYHAEQLYQHLALLLAEVSAPSFFGSGCLTVVVQNGRIERVRCTTERQHRLSDTERVVELEPAAE